MPAQRRGTKFEYSNELDGDWVASMFTQFWFTIRKTIPNSDVVDDSDAGVVAQGTLTGGHIVFSDQTNFTVRFTSLVTKTWPKKDCFFDMKGLADDVYLLSSGELPILGDVTRSAPSTP
jgi:hypothetical protein